MAELVVVSNRLPLQLLPSESSSYSQSPGGLVSALHPILVSYGGTWIGSSEYCKTKLLPTICGYKLIPIEFYQSDFQDYYNGYSNSILWPLFHNRPCDLRASSQWWPQYEKVNKIFAKETAETANKDSLVWVHDYHLLLVPKILKRYRPDIQIGFFLHTPFPNFTSFQRLPHWREIIEGISSSHVIGFQTDRDQQNFHVALYNSHKSYLSSRGETPKTTVNPVSIDFECWNQIANQPETSVLARRIKNHIGSDKTLIIGIDRLDKTKGILNRLIALYELLSEKKIEAKKIAMIVIACSSRNSSSPKDRYKLRIEDLILRINNEFGENECPVVFYTNRSMTPNQVSAFFSASDILIISSLQDGMNLTCKEFIANSIDNRGILILSKNAGAANNLHAALKIDPFNITNIKNSILTAINMTQSDAIERMKSLRNSVRSHNVYDWAKQFIDNLNSR